MIAVTTYKHGQQKGKEIINREEQQQQKENEAQDILHFQRSIAQQDSKMAHSVFAKRIRNVSRSPFHIPCHFSIMS